VIRAIDNKRLDLSDEEYQYYNTLVETFGKEDFSGLFSTDKNGQIISITPPVDRQISLGVIFFILNIMMNQRLRSLEDMIKKNENKVVEVGTGNNIVERVERLEAALGTKEDLE
jgi:hypothetical protein